MITAAVSNSFRLALAESVLGDQFKIALYTSAANLDADTTEYTTDGEVSGAGYATGGMDLEGITATLVGEAEDFDQRRKRISELSTMAAKFEGQRVDSDSLARMASGNVLRLIQHPQFQERCPLRLDKASEASWTITGNDGRPSMHAAGIQGQLTGQRADYLIFDDLIKSQSEAYSEVVRDRTWANFTAETRLLPVGRIVGIATRWHPRRPDRQATASSTGG
jgi:hypothetical protein